MFLLRKRTINNSGWRTHGEGAVSKVGGVIMEKPVESTNQVSTFVTDEVLGMLELKAKAKGVTVSEFVRLLIIESVVEPSVCISIDDVFSALPGVLKTEGR